MDKYKYPMVFSIAGSDSGGGAGIQADLKTISALGCFGTTAITAITVQNTMGVSAIHPIPTSFISAQIKAVMDDFKPSSIKIGMIFNVEVANTIAETLSHYPRIPIIFDPVMIASSGDKLIENNTVNTLKTALLPISSLVTPNLNEASLLAEMEINNLRDMKQAAIRINKFGCNAVLIKGGHLKGPDLYDFYLDQNGIAHIFSATRIATNNTHGTGCTLSSAIASFIALGNDLETSIFKSKEYIQSAIEHGKEVKTGNGVGPLNHFFNPEKMVKYEI